MNRARTAVAAALVALVLAVVAPPANSAGPGGGPLAFSGTASLPKFPCDPGPCSGTFKGTVSGALAGRDAGANPWAVDFTQATLTSSFKYKEPKATCPLTGTASGTIKIAAPVTLLAGRYVYGSSGRVATVTSATGTGSFSWTRVGSTAAITLSSVKVILKLSDGTSKTVMSLGSGAASAQFKTANPPNCSAPAATTATVAGEGEVSKTS